MSPSSIAARDIDPDGGSVAASSPSTPWRAGSGRRESVEHEFTTFVAANYARLLHAADLLTCDRGRAEDILQAVLAHAYLRWPRIGQRNPLGYIRAGLVNAETDWWRRRSSWERPVAAPAEDRGGRRSRRPGRRS